MERRLGRHRRRSGRARPRLHPQGGAEGRWQAAAGAAHLARAAASLRTLRSLIATALRRFDAAADDAATLEAVDFQTAMTMLKVEASELAVVTVTSAMRACGLAGYRNDGEFSIGRHLRDVLSAPIMISNDRILANIAAAALIGGTPASLAD